MLCNVIMCDLVSNEIKIVVGASLLRGHYVGRKWINANKINWFWNLIRTWVYDFFIIIDSDKQTEALQIEDQIIANTSQIKLLGVEIDDKLNFTSHISNICIKASQKVGVLLRLRNLIPCKAKLIIYKSSILPHLTYCHLVWHNCRSSDSRKIERIQERALRAVFNSHSESYENLLVRAELPSLLNRRLQDIAILMYKVKYGLAPSIVNELFKRKSTSYSLRNSDFDIPTFNTINYGKHSLRYQGPHIWSKLDIKLKGSSNIESFKKNIRKKDLTSLLNNNNSCCNLCNS